MELTPVLYLDSSFWRRLFDSVNPELRRATRDFLRRVGRRCVLKTSDLVARELGDVPFDEIRRRVIRTYRAARPRVVTTAAAVHCVVRELLGAGCLNERHLEDLYHIAYAVVGGADFLVTWDTGDLARPGTQDAVGRCCRLIRRHELLIETPPEVGR